MNDAKPTDEASLESLVAAVADEFMAQWRQGTDPDVEDFARRHPEIADFIRRVLPALRVLGRSTSGSAAPSPPTPSDELVGTLGDFRLVREIGRGGMGVVYDALQISLGRQVALKVLPFAAALDPKQLQRFKTEAQAAAHLHHPHIVPVFAVGCERGVHYYAMQFIEGQSLDRLIDELGEASRGVTSRGTSPPTLPIQTGQSPRPLPAPPTGRPGSLAATIRSTSSPAYYRMAANLGVQAAEALEHAHQLGIVHRDIKPGNLMVDDQGQLWITDFGLARCQSDAGLTLSGDLVGTIRYMSPEQALGRRVQIDHRTDIYSLGATLYELLTLAPVFAGNDRQELLQRIAFDDPAPLRRVRKPIPPELETIVIKAMQKQREDRYQTAQELADDLGRFLEDKPIMARKPTLVEKAAKWSRRHRAVVASAVVLLVMAVVALGTSTVLIGREQARTKAAYDLLAGEEARTRTAYQAEAQQRALAEEHFRQARRVVDFFAQLSEAELRDKPEVRRKFLEAALQYYQAFIEQHHDAPTIQADLQDSYGRVAQILREIGPPAAAQAASKFLQGGSLLRLLREEAVQKALELSEGQAAKITELNEGRWEMFRDFRGWGPEAWYAWSQKVAASEAAALAVLQPEQTGRLQQIALQLRGPSALADPDVADVLQLDAGQKEKIRIILEGTRRSSVPPSGPRFDWPARHWMDYWRRSPNERGRGTEDDPERVLAAKKTEEQLLNVLRAEQQAKWKDLNGEPFQGEVRWGLPGGFPPWFEFRLPR